MLDREQETRQETKNNVERRQKMPQTQQRTPAVRALRSAQALTWGTQAARLGGLVRSLSGLAPNAALNALAAARNDQVPPAPLPPGFEESLPPFAMEEEPAEPETMPAEEQP